MTEDSQKFLTIFTTTSTRGGITSASRVWAVLPNKGSPPSKLIQLGSAEHRAFTEYHMPDTRRGRVLIEDITRHLITEAMPSWNSAVIWGSAFPFSLIHSARALPMQDQTSLDGIICEVTSQWNTLVERKGGEGQHWFISRTTVPNIGTDIGDPPPVNYESLHRAVSLMTLERFLELKDLAQQIAQFGVDTIQPYKDNQ